MQRTDASVKKIVDFIRYNVTLACIFNDWMGEFIDGQFFLVNIEWQDNIPVAFSVVNYRGEQTHFAEIVRYEKSIP